jgi:hypothetical protein
MKTNTQGDGNKVVNSEEENAPVNPQDNQDGGDKISKDVDKKKGYSEGLRNDSDTSDESEDEKETQGKEKF